VVDYDDAVIRDALHRLERRGLTRLASGAGSRAAKHRHLLAQALPMDAGEHAIVCVLMLRGPQTPGELKQRTERMHAFSNLEGVNETLRRLIERRLVARLDRRPGHKEERYVQLLQANEVQQPAREPLARADEAQESPLEPLARAAPAGQPPELDGLHARVARLEREVAELRAAMRHPVGEHQP
jgi:hypothetical protein